MSPPPNTWIHVLPPENQQWTCPMTKVSALALNTVPLPTPQKGEVLVKIHAVSLNSRDIDVCNGKFEHPTTLPPPGIQPVRASDASGEAMVPCSDMCGTVILSDDKKLKQGTRVMAIFNQSHLHGDMTPDDISSSLGYPLQGVLAQYRCFPAESLVVVPEYLTNEEASCLPLAAVTAWSSLSSVNLVQGKAAVLLQGMNPVSLAGLQIAKAQSLRVIATAPTEDLVQRAKDLGADEVINHQTHWEWQDAVLKATNDKGVDVVFENGGARTLRKSFACVAFGGEIHAIGYKGTDGDNDDEKKGNKTPQLHRLNVSGLALQRNVTLRAVMDVSKAQFEEMVKFYSKNKIRPVVDKVFEFEKAKEAMEYVDSGKGEIFGKVVIRVDTDTDTKS